jgi:peptide/nickel transport system substrate-binding protein
MLDALSSRKATILSALLALVLAAQPAKAGEPLVEIPMLAERVAKKLLPPMAERLPALPRVVPLSAMGREVGHYGGTLRMLMGDQRDIRMATIYGYARLVGFDVAGKLQPDLLAGVEVEADRIFTLRLRPGHRWSDGQPFTAEDFRYWWEDVANNNRLTRSGLPLALLAEGKPPRFEVLDPLTVRYTWASSNPKFLPALAGAQPQTIMMPAHYMRQFHTKYADRKQLEAEIAKARVRDWGALHERKSRSYRPENPDLPVLDPWVNRVAPPAERFVFERNPYFHRVDERGQQLPYIDRIEMLIGSSSLIPAKVASGEADLQARYLRFDNYTFLREHEKRRKYHVLLWDQGTGSQIALKPNLNTADPVLRALFRDVRFRRALSLGINRKDINQVIFYGLGAEAANSVLPGSPLYDERQARAYTAHDPAEANRLLDQLGLTRRNAERIRLLPDGRPAFLTIETAGESTEETDVLQLVADDFRAIGIRIFVRSTQRDVFRRRAIAGQNEISVWQGFDNATPSPDHEPEELAPSSPTQFEWPLWGQYVATAGKEGEKPALPAAQRLVELHRQWATSMEATARERIWREMLAVHAEELFTIGIVNRTKQPVVVAADLRNIPKTGIFSFEPRAFFGAYHPETFFWARKEDRP